MGGGGGGGAFEMMLEGPLVARVIGKGGENIKRLQEETGAKIVIIQVRVVCLVRNGKFLLFFFAV